MIPIPQSTSPRAETWSEAWCKQSCTDMGSAGLQVADSRRPGSLLSHGFDNWICSTGCTNRFACFAGRGGCGRGLWYGGPTTNLSSYLFAPLLHLIPALLFLSPNPLSRTAPRHRPHGIYLTNRHVRSRRPTQRPKLLLVENDMRSPLSTTFCRTLTLCT